ncbi:J domain-containing protein [Caballeronia novacaledonica]|uniref:J domain-containing protein n=2 Tax=Caballeronia novacaledonica TaxID=1544861 RepID=A0ACB5QPU4_9BURK|nr:DnaJ domain-containing protein [Caballeronia novacaledonica]GJH17088.1 J domain-containing protein [Caballeronia novacaledonica]GJH30611.1 J domain-containing protein [Caballeronia novacaledonica]
MATLYQTLGVDEHATEEEIKRAYRKAAMRCHPDRNVGNEDIARAKFLEIKEAYGILSDPAQREVYDRIYADEMRRWEERVRQEEAEREAREAKEREAREALYAERVSLAMRFASQGYNRDVVFGVLLGAQCEEPAARQIADSAIALHESRQAREEIKEREEETATNRKEEKEPASADAANPLGAMWFQFLNNLRF